MDLQSETPQTSANHEDLRILADIFREMVVDGDMKNTLILIKTSLIHSTNNTSAVTEWNQYSYNNLRSKSDTDSKQ